MPGNFAATRWDRRLEIEKYSESGGIDELSDGVFSSEICTIGTRLAMNIRSRNFNSIFELNFPHICEYPEGTGVSV